MSTYETLRPKQKAFVDEFVRTGNASTAAKKAGYKGEPKVTGSKLMASASIAKAIKERGQRRELSRIASADEVLEGLTEIARNGEKEETRLQAYIALGKRYALFTDGVKHDASANLHRTITAIFMRANKARLKKKEEEAAARAAMQETQPASIPTR